MTGNPVAAELVRVTLARRAELAILRSIVKLLDGREWDGETCSDIADVLRDANYTVRDISEVES
jgi:hypothetical protein